MTVCYELNELRAFRKASTLKENFSSFTLALKTRRKIIVMGIHRHPRLYRRSWAGTKLLYNIFLSINHYIGNNTTKCYSGSYE